MRISFWLMAQAAAATTTPAWLQQVWSPERTASRPAASSTVPLDAPVGGHCVDVVHHERALVEGVGVVEHALTPAESAEVLFRVALDRFCREEQAQLLADGTDDGGGLPGASQRWRLQGIEDLEQMVYQHPDSELVATARLNIGVAWLREARSLDQARGLGQAAPVVDGTLHYGRFESPEARHAAATGAAELQRLVDHHSTSPAAPRAYFHIGLHNWLEQRDLPAAQHAMLQATNTYVVGPESLTIATYAGLLLMEAEDHDNARKVLLNGMIRERDSGHRPDRNAQDWVQAVDALAWTQARTPHAAVSPLVADLESLAAPWTVDRGLQTVVRAALANDALVLAESAAAEHLARFPDHAEAPRMQAAIVGTRVRAPGDNGTTLDFTAVASAADAFVHRVRPDSTWNQAQSADTLALTRAEAAAAWHTDVVAPTLAHIDRLFAATPEDPHAEPWWELATLLVDRGHAALPDRPTALDDVARMVTRHLESRPHLSAWLAGRVFSRLGPDASHEQRREVVETWADAAGRAVDRHFASLDPSAAATQADHHVRSMYACALWSGWVVTGEPTPALDAARNLTLVDRPDLAEAVLTAVPGLSGPDREEVAVEVERGLLVYRYRQGRPDGDIERWCSDRVQAPLGQAPRASLDPPTDRPHDLAAAARAHINFARKHQTHPDAPSAAHHGIRYALEADLAGLAEAGQTLMVARFPDFEHTPAHRVDLAVRYQDTLRLDHALTTFLDAAHRPPPGLDTAPILAEATRIADATGCAPGSAGRAALQSQLLRQAAPVELARLAEACGEDAVAIDLYVEATDRPAPPDLAVAVALGRLLERHAPAVAPLHWLEWDSAVSASAVHTHPAAAQVRLEATRVRLEQLRAAHGLDTDLSRWDPNEVNRRSELALDHLEARAGALYRSLAEVDATACATVDARRLQADVAVVVADAFAEAWIPSHLTADQAVLYRERLHDTETSRLTHAADLLEQLHLDLIAAEDPAVALCPGAVPARRLWVDVSRRLDRPDPVELGLGNHLPAAPYTTGWFSEPATVTPRILDSTSD